MTRAFLDRDGFGGRRGRAGCRGLWRRRGQHAGPYRAGLRRGAGRSGPCGPAQAAKSGQPGAGGCGQAGLGGGDAGGGDALGWPMGLRPPRFPTARTRLRATGNWPGCRCLGTGIISPTPTRPFRQSWWPRSAVWPGPRGFWATAMPRACPSSRPIAKSICERAGRSATPAPIRCFRLRRMKRPFGLERLLKLCQDLAPTLHAMKVGRVIARPFTGGLRRFPAHAQQA